MMEVRFVDRVSKWKLEERRQIQNTQTNKNVNIFQNSHLICRIFIEFLVVLKVRNISGFKVSFERPNF